MWYKINMHWNKKKLVFWLAKSKLPFFLTTVKVRLWLILILFILMIVLLFYAFNKQYPEFRETSIVYNKTQSLLFNKMYIHCDLREKSAILYYELMNNFLDFKERNDSLIFNERNSLNDKLFPKSSLNCNYFCRKNSTDIDSIMIYGFTNLTISNISNVKLDESYNKFYEDTKNECQSNYLYQSNVKDNKKVITNRIERYYYKNKGLCSDFNFQHFKFGGEDMYSPNDNPYTLYQLFMPDYEKNDFYGYSDDFQISIILNQGKTLVLDIFPEPSLKNSRCISYKGRKKLEEIIENQGVYIYLQDIEKANKISRFQNYASLLAGAILAWIVELFVSIILVWKRLVVTK